MLDLSDEVTDGTLSSVLCRPARRKLPVRLLSLGLLSRLRADSLIEVNASFGSVARSRVAEAAARTGLRGIDLLEVSRPCPGCLMAASDGCVEASSLLLWPASLVDSVGEFSSLALAVDGAWSEATKCAPSEPFVPRLSQQQRRIRSSGHHRIEAHHAVHVMAEIKLRLTSFTEQVTLRRHFGTGKGKAG